MNTFFKKFKFWLLLIIAIYLAFSGQGDVEVDCIAVFHQEYCTSFKGRYCITKQPTEWCTEYNLKKQQRGGGEFSYQVAY